MSIVNKRLSKEALEAITGFKEMMHGAGDVQVDAIEESRGGMWGATFRFYDDTKELVAEETYLTTPGSTRRVAAFIVLFENGKVADTEWQPLFMPERSKTLSDLIVSLIEEDITPSLLTMGAAEFEVASSCEIGGDDDDDDEEADFPCSECDPEEGECDSCSCAKCDDDCNEEIRSECPNDPFKEEEEG